VADQEKIGTDWGEDELDAILVDYFAMLAEEIAGRAYVKARHSAELMQRIGRTHRSVEFKHMNISAVLSELGLPTIRGYKPKPNYQGAIIGAVERYLAGNPEIESLVEAAVPREQRAMEEAAMLYEEQPPLRGQVPWARDPNMERIVRKFDPGVRDARNRALGLAGERLVFDAERRRLSAAGRSDLAAKIRWVAQEDGDGAGYDIRSFNEVGDERLLEVKTTLGSRTTPFLLTRNEYDLSCEQPEAFRICRVFEFSKTPRLFKVRPPLDQAVKLSPEVYRASF
jgi:hypothetical protein